MEFSEKEHKSESRSSAVQGDLNVVHLHRRVHHHLLIAGTVVVVVLVLVVLVLLHPMFQRSALRLVPRLPVQRLARPGAVVHRPAHRAPTELVPPRLRSPAPAVRAQPQPGPRRRAPLREPLRQETARRVRLRRGHAAPEVAEQRAAGGGPDGSVPRVPHRGGDGGGGGEHGGELAGVGLDEEAAALGDVLADAVAVLEAVAELAEGVDVAEEGRPGAQRHPRAQVLVRLRPAGAVELYHGQGVERRGVGGYSRPGHERRPAPPALHAVEPDLQSFLILNTLVNNNNTKTCSINLLFSSYYYKTNY